MCKRGHHSALCETKLSDPAKEKPPHIEKETSANIVSTPASMLVGSKSKIALQTAQALVKGNNSRIRVLFDSGSHKAFVTAKVARAYNLSVIRKEWLSISTFGQKTLNRDCVT